MLSIYGPLRASRAVKYYANGESCGFDGDPLGVWGGSAANAFSLYDKAVSTQAFENLLNGFSPCGTEKLVSNAGSHNRQAGIDLGFGSPPDLSRLRGIADEEIGELIDSLQLQATQRAIKYAEDNLGYARGGAGGAAFLKASFIAGFYQQYSNQEHESFLHTHVVMMNMGLCADGEWRSLSTFDIYRAKLAIGAIYRAELAYLLEAKLGLQLERGQYCFSIAGVITNAREQLSSRGAQIKERLASFRGEPTARAARDAAVHTRKKVKEFVPVSELHRRWREAALKFGWTWEDAKKLFGRVAPKGDLKALERLVVESIASLTKGKAYFAERDVVRLVAYDAKYLGVNADQILSHVRTGLKAAGIVSLGNYSREPVFTTEEILAAEAKLMELVMAGKGDRKHAVMAQDFIRYSQSPSIAHYLGLGNKLSREQISAASAITTKASRISVLTAQAGVDIYQVLGVARQVWKQAGFRTIGLTFSDSGITNLHQGSKFDAYSAETRIEKLEQSPFGLRVGKSRLFPRARRKFIRNLKLPSLYFQWKKARLNQKTVLVVDGAEKLDTKEMTTLVSAVERKGAKLVLVGNLESMRSFGPGAPFKHIAQKLDAYTLKSITSQALEWRKEMIRFFADGKAEQGISLARKNDVLMVLKDSAEAKERIVQNWSQLGVRKPRENLILTVGSKEAQELSRKAQRKRKRAGKLGVLGTKLGKSKFYKNDRVIFAERAKSFGLETGSIGTVVKINRQVLVAKLDNGKKVTVPLRYYNPDAIQLAYAIPVSRAHGLRPRYAFALIDPERQDRYSSTFQASMSSAFTRFYTDVKTAGAEFKNLSELMGRNYEKDLATSIQEKTGVGRRSAHEEEQKQTQQRQSMSL